MHRSSRRRRLVLGVSLLALFTAAASTSAQPPADGESAVPVLPPGPDNSLLEALATDASGRVAVLWTRLGQGSAGSVWYRRFGPDDSPLTPPIRLASESSRPTASGLLANGPGDLLISWSTQGADGGSTWFVRRVSANRGIHQWSGRGTVQATALDDSGRIAIVSKRFGRSAWHLVAQRYDARLAPFGPEIELATGATGGPIPGRATAAFQPRTGSLVVVWETLERPTAARLVGRLLHWRRREPDSMVLLATGKGSDPLHPSPFSPAIAWGQGERWAATWTIHPETADAPGSTGIWLATFRGAFEDPIRRRIADTFPDGAARLAASANGRILLTWDDNGTSPVHVQLFDSHVEPEGPARTDLLVSDVYPYLGAARSAFLPTGRFALGWTNFGDDEDLGWNPAFERFALAVLR